MNETLRSRAVRRSILLALVAAVSGTVQADVFTAQTAYNKGDFEQAFKEFKELAELGQPTAQYDLAIMYARGAGVQPNELYAYAWASIAADNGFDAARELQGKLRPDLSPASRQRISEIRDRFGPKALEERLLPKIQADATAAAQERQSCRTTRDRSPEFPASAWQQGLEGGVYAEYTLLADGTARDPRVLYARPEGVFDSSVRESLLHSRFAGSEGKTIVCTKYYEFTKKNEGFRMADPTLAGYMEKVHSEATAGRADSQLLYGLMISGLPQLQRPRSEALSWFLHAAQSGSAIAQYQVGHSLLTGWGCQRDEGKGLLWMHLAADHDQPNAQVALAEYALRGTPDEEKVREAKGWLDRAAASGNREGKIRLAALLAAAPYADVRDPSRARSLSDDAFAGVTDDPTGFEIRAAAAASAGDFDAAATEEGKALEQASRLGWNLAPLKDRLAHYQAHQPWSGDLLGVG